MDGLNAGPSFFEIGQESVDSELNRSLNGHELTYSSFQSDPEARARIQVMMNLIELCLKYFISKGSVDLDEDWGVREKELLLIERRMTEVFGLNYLEYVSVFSFMSMTVDATAKVMNDLMIVSAPKTLILEKLPFFKTKKSQTYIDIKEKTEFFQRYALIIRGLYLKNKNLDLEDWKNIERKLDYIKNMELFLRSRYPQFVDAKTAEINVNGLIWLQERLKKNFANEYESFVEDFPSIAEAWIRGVVTAKYSLQFSDRKKLNETFNVSSQSYKQLSNTIIDLYDLEKGY